MGSRALALGIALVADRVIPEPPDRWHPVAWFGSAMTAVEQKIWHDDRRSGVVYAGVGLSLGVVVGALVRSTPVALTISIAAAQLRSVGANIGDILRAGDLDASRDSLRALVGRDPTELNESGIAAAVVESVAENTVDAVIAPMFWALIAGAPGALGYRAVNTMDAMVGHRSKRYERFGWASARLDDAANWVPARLFALLMAATNPSRFSAIRRAVRSDAPAHPSPNAGVAEASVAGALDLELGGPLRYGERVENRPRLGSGDRPAPHDITRAIQVTDRAQLAFAAAGAVVAVARRTRQ